MFDQKLLTFFKVVPHITDAIQAWIERVAHVPVDGKEGPADVCVIELGGTIGTLPCLILPFLTSSQMSGFFIYIYVLCR